MAVRRALAAVALLAAAACAQQEAAVTGSAPLAGEGTPSTSPPATDVGGTADAIPVAHTPSGGWTTMPAPVLAGCTEPLVAGAPDLRGMWRVVEVDVAGQPDPTHRALGHVQRVEQCGDRLVVTAGGIIHDMRNDGTEANGVNDVAEADKTTPITVVATYEDGVHVLRPVGLPVEVTRRRDGDDLIWTYLGFTARLERLGPPEMDPPATAAAPTTPT